MKINESFIKEFDGLAKSQNFVFSDGDVQSLLNQDLNPSFYRSYKKLFELGLLKRFCRGTYIAKNFKLIDVNKKLDDCSYISFEYVLAENSLIGTYSDKLLRSVTIKGKTRRFAFQDYTLEQYKISEDLFFGYNNVNGYYIATPEKAYLDCLYYYTKGMKFSFNLFSDVDTTMLDRGLIKKYLKKFKNKKFVSFVVGVLKND